MRRRGRKQPSKKLDRSATSLATLSLPEDASLSTATLVRCCCFRFIFASSIIFAFARFNVTQIVVTHQEEGYNGLFTAFFVSGGAFSLVYLSWFAAYHPADRELLVSITTNSIVPPPALCPLIKPLMLWLYHPDKLRKHPHMSFLVVLLGCILSSVYSHFIRYSTLLNPALAKSGTIDDVDSSWNKPFTLITLSLTCAFIDALQWLLTGMILRSLLKIRVNAESERRARMLTTPTSEELFNLHSLNQWNPMNSPAGISTLLFSLILSSIPHSFLMCIIDTNLLPPPPDYVTAVMIQFLSELTGSLMSSAVIFSIHQSWCDFSGNNMVPSLESKASVTKSKESQESKEFSSAIHFSEGSSKPSGSIMYSGVDLIGPISEYRGIEATICFFSLICCMNYIPAEVIDQMWVSPKVFLPFLSFLIVIWPTLRFGNAGTSVAILLTFVFNSVNICSNGFGNSFQKELSHIRPYPVRWMMFVFQTFSVLLTLCSLLMSSSSRQLVELENGLQRVVRLRTHQLREAGHQLAQRMDDAIKASTTKTQFLATMSHEIRTPMNGVIGMAELLDLTVLSPEQAEYVSGIRASSQHLLNIINNILDFSKLEDGKMTLRISRVRMQTIIDQCIALARQDKFDHLIIKYEQDESFPHWIMVDTTRFKQVVVNILTNALKFTEVGGVTIKANQLPLSSKEESQFRKHVQDFPHHMKRVDGDSLEEMPLVKLLFSVVDTGIGIAKDQIPHLFQSFGQLDASSTREYGGTGLGLVISHRIVDLMAGKIWVDSEIGQGTSFRFTIITFVPDSSSLPTSHPSSPIVSPVRSPPPSTNQSRVQYDYELARLLPALSSISHIKLERVPKIMVAHPCRELLREFKRLEDSKLIELIYSTSSIIDARHYILEHQPLPAEVCVINFTYAGADLIWEILKAWKQTHALLFPRRPSTSESSLPPTTVFPPSVEAVESSLPRLILFCSHSCLPYSHSMIPTSATDNPTTNVNIEAGDSISDPVDLEWDAKSLSLLFRTGEWSAQRRLIISLLNHGLLHVVHQPFDMSTIHQQLLHFSTQPQSQSSTLSRPINWSTILLQIISQSEGHFRESSTPSVATSPDAKSFRSLESFTASAASTIDPPSILSPASTHRSLKSVEMHRFASLYPHSILIVEDNLINQKVLFSMLKRLGYDHHLVSFAVNGQQAVDMASYHSPDVISSSQLGPARWNWDIILMDIQMPVMDGREATKRILESFQTSNENPPIIVAVTANILPADKLLYLSTGFNDYLAKPYSINQIKALLIKWTRQ